MKSHPITSSESYLNPVNLKKFHQSLEWVRHVAFEYTCSCLCLLLLFLLPRPGFPNPSMIHMYVCAPTLQRAWTLTYILVITLENIKLYTTTVFFLVTKKFQIILWQPTCLPFTVFAISLLLLCAIFSYFIFLVAPLPAIEVGVAAFLQLKILMYVFFTLDFVI